MEVDRTAPAVAHSEIEIAAPPEVVWDVLADIGGWPSWNPDVKRASLEGALAEGTTFRWKAGPGTITSTLRRVEPPRMIGWTGKTLGIAATHVYRLERRAGGTLVTSEESWRGLLVRLLRRRMAKTLGQSLDSGLRHLKTEAERRAAAS
jgi:uncharacterized protein YndB with AHSA1/START domain